MQENPYVSPNPLPAVLSSHSDAEKLTRLSEPQIVWLQRTLTAMWLTVVIDFVVAALIAFRAASFAYQIMSLNGIANMSEVTAYFIHMLTQSIGLPIVAIFLWKHSTSIANVLQFGAAMPAVDHAIRTGCRFWVVQTCYTLIIATTYFAQIMLEIWY